MRIPSNQSALGKYLVTGLGICVALQTVLAAQIGSFDHPALSAPFLVAYSQKAMLDLLIYEAPWPIRVALWLLAYAVIGVVLWRILVVASPAKAGRWRTVVLAWAAAELVLALIGWALAARGILHME